MRPKRQFVTDDIIAQHKAAARHAGLSYCTDDSPGIKRIKSGSGFSYVSPKGKQIHDEKTLARIKSLVIPPAWENVWICTNPRGHIQAVGRDARGRKQYKYHPHWRETRDSWKYHRLIDFARILPRLRRTARRHLNQPGLPHEKVLAAVVLIMEKTLIRVGNEEYASENHSYGLTTLRDRHARIVNGHKVHFEFRGKSGKKHEIDLDDPKLARIVRQCRDLPGEELFQYRGEAGEICNVTSNDVNDYLRRLSGSDFTAKDFRTWAGTVLCAKALRQIGPFQSKTEAKRNLLRAIERVAEHLGNTKAVCRRSYIHPAIMALYMDGYLLKQIAQRPSRLHNDEAVVLTLLRHRAKPAMSHAA
jgi:DNA topoisomerase-1